MWERFWQMAMITVLAVLPVVIACSEDTPTGPQFGDLEFVQPPPLGLGRETSTTLSNVSGVALGEILIGAEAAVGIDEIFGIVCSDTRTDLMPASVSALDPGSAVPVNILIDMSTVDLADCPAGSYDIGIYASTGGLVLAATSVEISWTGEN